MSGERLYRLLPHVCRSCGGRAAVSRPDRSGLVRVCCTVCDDAAEVPAGTPAPHELLCMCGVKVPGLYAVALRCVVNENRGPDMPHAYITAAVQVGE